MSKLPVSQQDRLFAQRLLRAMNTRNKVAIAEELAAIREVTIRCALVCVEQEFKVKRKREA